MAIIEIPAGPNEVEMRRVIDLDLVDTMKEIKLIDRRHWDDKHRASKKEEIIACIVCTEISKRAYEIAHTI